MLAYDKHKLVAAFLTPCELTLPFNLVHTSNLSDWSGNPSHEGWRSVIRGLANLCGRPGVGMLAEAQVSGSPESLARWAKQFPDEPLAKEMWESHSAHLRLEFAADLQKARAELSAFLDNRRSDGEAVLARASDDFAGWLDAERIGKAAQRPSPSAMIGPLLFETQKAGPDLRPEVERLKADLARANKRAEAATKELESIATGALERTHDPTSPKITKGKQAAGGQQYAEISLIVAGIVVLLSACASLTIGLLQRANSIGLSISAALIVCGVATIGAGLAARRK
jgi:hypothetical protein